MKGVSAGEHKLVSVDVFDTLLLRGRESERRRMAWISQAVADAIRPLGFDRKPAHVLHARNTAQAIAYNALRVTGDLGDVTLAEIHKLQCLALGLPESLLPTMAEAEIKVDAHALRANRRLVIQLERLRSEGARVVAVSDTYYSAKDLDRLLRSHGAEQAIDAIYSSADYRATKKSGRLFPLVAAAEGVDARTILHLGDDRIADFEMPRAKGLATRWSPRPRSLRLARKIDAALLLALPLPANGGTP
jgi:predicted HAD superfamily hydrolase